jgi:hypothetical protein
MSAMFALVSASKAMSFPSLSRKRAMPGTRSRNRLPSICQVGPAALAPSRVAGTAPCRMVTSGATVARHWAQPRQGNVAAHR